jgi:hypothetical protein
MRSGVRQARECRDICKPELAVSARQTPLSSLPSAQLRTGAGTHNPREKFGED